MLIFFFSQIPTSGLWSVPQATSSPCHSHVASTFINCAIEICCWTEIQHHMFFLFNHYDHGMEQLVFKGLVHRTKKRPKTELDQTGGCSCMLFKQCNRTNLNRLQPVAHVILLRNAHILCPFWEKWTRIAWVMAKMICFSKIWLCATSHNCIFWVLDNFYCHKNFMGSYYTLYTIFYISFYVPNIIKIQVLISFYSLWQKLKKTSLDWFQLVAVPVFWYFWIRQPVAVAHCLFLDHKTRPDWTGPVNTTGNVGSMPLSFVSLIYF